MAAVRITLQHADVDVAVVTVLGPHAAASGIETVRGAAAASVSSPHAAAAAAETISASGVLRAPSAATEGSAAENVGGSGAPGMPSPHAAASGTQTIDGSGSAIASTARATVIGSEIIAAGGHLPVPSPEAAASGISVIAGTAGAATPSPLPTGTATVSSILTVPGWPDPEDICRLALSDLGHFGTRTPVDVATELPFIQGRRTGGGDDRVTDTPRMVVTVYAATIAQAKQIAGEIQQRLIMAPVVTAAGIIDRGRTDAGPAEVPTGDPDVIRAIAASYRLSLRRF